MISFLYAVGALHLKRKTEEKQGINMFIAQKMPVPVSKMRVNLKYQPIFFCWNLCIAIGSLLNSS